MSDTGNQPPGGTPPASKPGDDEPPPSAQTLSASSSAPDSSPPSTSAPASTPPDSAPTSAPASAPPDSSADSKPADSSPPASDASPPPSQAPDSNPPDSDGCAEIPTAAHAVLQAIIKLHINIPFTIDEASPLPHKLTLTNDDSSYSKTLSFASDCQPGNADGTSLLSFVDLTEDHRYTLQCDDGNSSYSIFENIPYDAIVDQLASVGAADASPASSPSIVDPPPTDDAEPPSES